MGDINIAVTFKATETGLSWGMENPVPKTECPSAFGFGGQEDEEEAGKEKKKGVILEVGKSQEQCS